MLRRVGLRAASAAAAAHPAAHAEGQVSSTSVAGGYSFPRSSYQYESSAKGGEVGARNEAAKVPYQPHTAANTSHVAWGTPSHITLLTEMPINIVIGLCSVWGLSVFIWYLSCGAKNYETVVIERPKE